MSDSFNRLCDSVPRPPGKGPSPEFWRKDLPIQKPDGTWIGGMWPSQRKWWELPNFIKVLSAGLGAGKTEIACKRIIALALENAPCPVAVVCPTFPIARTTVIPTIEALLTGKQYIYGANAFAKKFNITTHEFRFRFHGRNAWIIVYSGEHPNSLRGINLAGALIDEAFLQDYAVMQQMSARVRHPDAKHRELLLTGSPEGLSWGYDLCVGELKDHQDIGLVKMSTRENLALPPEYVERLEATYDDRVCRSYVDGEFVDFTAGQVFHTFSPVENVVELPPSDTVELGVGMDFNVQPMSAAVFWHAPPHMHYFDEISLENSDTEYMCQHLREKYGDRLREVYPDPSGNQRRTNSPAGKTDFHYLKHAGYTVNAPSAHPALRDLWNSVNGKMKPRDGKVTLTISPKCKKLIKNLSIYTHSRRNKEDHKAMYHLLAAFSYPIHYLYPVSRDRVTVVNLRGL